MVCLRAFALPITAVTRMLSSPASCEISLENNRFQVEAGKLVFWRMARRVLLPVPIRAAITCLRAVGYAVEGLRCLLRGEICVEVLDATAIVASCLRGQFSEAGTISFLLQLSGRMEEHVQARAHLALRDGMSGARTGQEEAPGDAQAGGDGRAGGKGGGLEEDGAEDG